MLSEVAKSNICDKKVETHLLFREFFINLY